MIEQKIAENELSYITNLLADLELFKKLPKSSLAELAASMKLISLGGGEILLRQGEVEPSVYVLLQGRLRVFAKSENLQDLITAEITPGEIVGEISLLTNQPSLGTVRAVRDSLLLKLDRETFQKFESRHAEAVIDIAKAAIKRLVTKPKGSQYGEHISTIAVAPAGDSNPLPFAYRLAQEFNKLAPTLLVNQEYCNHHFGRDIAQTKLDKPDNVQITSWLQSLENRYGYIIYETDRQMSPWTQRCLRQADRILLVAEDGREPILNSIEISIFSGHFEFLPLTELVLVHPDDKKKIMGTRDWLKSRRVYGYHHLRLSNEADFARLIRFLTGRAFGVVLSGGGARGFIHIGVLQALDELKIPIDFIAGNSIGSVIAGGYALGMGGEGILEIANDFVYSFRKDYTLPLIALMKGKHLCDFLQRHCGDTYIEDLWTRFFCVSTNVTQAKLHVHDRGLLWLGIRASSSVPAVYPPIYDEGNMLVDGGIINNMPVDVMRESICGGKILAVNCHANTGEDIKYVVKNAWVSGWQLFFERMNPFRKSKTEYDNIFKILLASIMLSSDLYQRLIGEEPDYLLEFDTSKYGLLEFQVGKEIIDVGYRLAIEKLPEMLKDLKL